MDVHAVRPPGHRLPPGPPPPPAPPHPMEVSAHHHSPASSAPTPSGPGPSAPTPSSSPEEQSHSDGEFCFMENSHPDRMLEALNRLRLRRAFCDVILCCGELELPCHRNVLAAFSSYFEAMFESEWKESHQSRVNINGVESQSVDLLVTFAYTSKVLITASNVQGLLAAANLLNITSIVAACCSFMETHMDEKNCVGIHCFAEAHCCTLLEKQSKDYILEHFTVVYRQDELLTLSVNKLTEILSDDDLNVSKEETVFEAAMLWLNKCPTRNHVFEKVLEHIRLPLISPSYLRDVIQCVDVVRRSQRCQKLISEAKDQGPRPRTSTVTEVIVTIGGQEDKEMLHSVESFEPTTNQWKTLACLPFAVRRHCMVVAGCNLYLCGGELADGSISRETWSYDHSTDCWLQRSPMNEPRCDFGLVYLSGCLFAVGGREGQSRMERYHPKNNSWQFVASVGVFSYCDSPAVVELDGFIYYIGGSVMHQGYRTDVSSTYRCDIMNKPLPVWTQLAPMSVARFGAAAVTLNGKIYVMGGWSSTQTTSSVERYDPQTDSWTLCSSMMNPRCHPGVAVLDGRIYVLGGKEGFLARYHRSMECYSEDRDQWEAAGDMPSGRSWLGCVALRLRRDGRVAVASSSSWDDASGEEAPETSQPELGGGEGGPPHPPHLLMDPQRGRLWVDHPDGPPALMDPQRGRLWAEHPGGGPAHPMDPRGRLWAEHPDGRFWELDPLAMRMWRRRWRARRRVDMDLDN